jgi:PAS domain S-box-containing protein
MESHLRENRFHGAGPDRQRVCASEQGGACGKSFRLLHIDDSASDRALVGHELRKEFPGLTLISVLNEQELQEAIKQGGFDVVVTDYELRWTNGIQIAAKILKEYPRIPVIMFTGTGNEEVAVEAMKAGVEDYIIKTTKNLRRLRDAVRQAMEDVGSLQELVYAEARYKELFDTVPVGLFRSTPQGRILDANAAFLQMAGMGDLSDRRNFSEIHPQPEDFAVWRDKLERDGAVTCVESRFLGRDGSTVWVEIHAKALRDAETREIYYEGSVEDISQRKNAEQEREQLIEELRQALGRVRSLAGLLPICSSCKKIRDSRGQWNMLESYIEKHSQAHFTHSFCPECARRLYPEIFLESPRS